MAERIKSVKIRIDRIVFRNMLANVLTEREIKAERLYRVQERLGILVGAGAVGPMEMAMAKWEADCWEAQIQGITMPEMPALLARAHAAKTRR